MVTLSIYGEGRKKDLDPKPEQTTNSTAAAIGKATPVKTANCTELISILAIGLVYSAGLAIALIAPAL